MNLEDLVEAHLSGEQPTVPPELREDFELALAGHHAIEFALGETLVESQATLIDRPAPSLSDDYEIVRELGRGGMGVVYLARQKSLGRNVAVKVLRPGEVTFGPLVKRFMDEAKHLARLRHPNIVPIHEVGQAGDEPYFTMDYIEGEPLSAVLARERLSPTRALAIWRQAAEAVQHAHENGTIHRDLKPGNILVDASGHAFVTDFGLARDLTRESNLTRSGEVMGTPAYMSPEQAQGQSELIGEATDVHALGVILYEMLSGQVPWGHDVPALMMARLIMDEPPPLRKHDRRIPRDLETICLKAMAKAPDRRYASVRAFLEDIRRFEAGEPVLARRPGPLHRAARFVRRHLKLVAAVTGAVAITAAVLLAIAPRLFDKSAEELIKWADEQHASGEHGAALKTYARAYRKATGADRPNILESMLRCGREAKDPKFIAEAAQDILEVDPDVSFQEFDYKVGEVWGQRQNAKDLGRLKPDEKRRLMEIGEKRLLMVLASTHCKEEEKKDAEMHLGRVRVMLAALKTAPELVFELPLGDPSELLLKAADPDGYEWSRGMAAFAAGFELEASGELPAALKAYRQAYDLMRPAFPTYSGRTSHIRAGREVEQD